MSAPLHASSSLRLGPRHVIPKSQKSCRTPVQPRIVSRAATKATDAPGTQQKAIFQPQKLLSSCAAAAAAVVLSTAACAPAEAIFNKGEDFTDVDLALPALMVTKLSMEDVAKTSKEYSTSCPAPTFPCDLSILLRKTISRVSGPVRRSLPILVEEYGADPYAGDDIVAAVLQAEAIFKSNDARVKVDFKGPVEFLTLAQGSLNQFLEDIPEDKIAEAQEKIDACDPTLDSRQPGSFECRVVRAIAQNAIPSS